MSRSSSGRGYVEEPGTDGPDVAWWCYEDHRASLKRTIAAAGFPRDEIELRGVRYDEMRPGCWRVRERLEDMDVNGVQAQLCFPNYPRFCGQQFLWGKDRELARLCVEAYNDWMVEEWCGESGGRLIPLCLVPLWDAELAAAEVRRNAGRGVRAVAFSELPTYLDLPSLYSGYWDPFLAACEETGDGRVHAHRLGHEDAHRPHRTARTPSPPPSSSATAWRASPTSCSRGRCTAFPDCA